MFDKEKRLKMSGTEDQKRRMSQAFLHNSLVQVGEVFEKGVAQTLLACPGILVNTYTYKILNWNVIQVCG